MTPAPNDRTRSCAARDVTRFGRSRALCCLRWELRSGSLRRKWHAQVWVKVLTL